jgi:hypothetical protein
MYPYKTLSKSQLIELLGIIESTLEPASQTALNTSKEYSTDLQSQLAFEVGHLNGCIRTTLSVIEDYKNC